MNQIWSATLADLSNIRKEQNQLIMNANVNSFTNDNVKEIIQILKKQSSDVSTTDKDKLKSYQYAKRIGSNNYNDALLNDNSKLDAAVSYRVRKILDPLTMG